MSPFLLVLNAFLSISVLTSTIGARTAWQQRAKPSAMPMFTLCLAIWIWAICYIVEINSKDLQTKVFWSTLKYPAVVIIPVILSIFLLRFAGWTDWPKPWFLICLLILPILTVLIAFTNQSHHLFWQTIDLQIHRDYSTLTTTYGPWFLVYALYSYALILMSSAVALASLARSWHLYKRQVLWLAVGVSLPLLANILSVLGAHPWPGVDLSPVAFGISALFLLSSSDLTGILNVSPLAHMTLMEQMRDGVVVLDNENRIHECNPAAEHILRQSYQDLIGKNILKIDHPVVTLLQLYTSGSTVQRDIQIDMDGIPYWYDMRVSEILPPGGRMVGLLVIWRDITERKRIENELRFSSTHDPLTGLYNRMYFEMDLERIRLGRYRSVTIVMIDLDLLKNTNDTYGHAAGDELIRQAANVLRSVFRKEDMVARIGGDEFSALLPDCDKNNARLLIERLYKALDRFNESGPAHPVSFSAGCATAGVGEDLSQTLQAADAQLYLENTRRKKIGYV